LEDTFEAELAKALQEEEETKRIETISPDQIPEEEEEELKFDFEEGTKRGPQVEVAPSSTLQRDRENNRSAGKTRKASSRKERKAVCPGS
jgi:hypothetical protein